MNPVRKRAYIYLLFVSLIWGVATPIIKFTLSAFPPSVFLTYRFFVSSIIAVIYFFVARQKLPKDRKTLAITAANGFLITTVGLGLLFLGMDKTTSIDSNLISAMAPITVAIAGVFFLKEKVTKRESFGLLIALAGTFLTIAEPVIKNKIQFGGLTGNLLVFSSVVVTTITAILAKKVLRKGVDPALVTNISFVVGFLTIIPFTFREISANNFTSITSVPFVYHLGVLYMSIVSGTIAYILWHKAEKSIEVSEV